MPRDFLRAAAFGLFNLQTLCKVKTKDLNRAVREKTFCGAINFRKTYGGYSL